MSIERHIGVEYKVLDHGFVRAIATMGDDAAVVQAARVSYGEGTKTVRKDRGLIRYLMRKNHSSPFEMAEIKLHCKMPIFVSRQWVRHRTASLNEYSGRYSEMSSDMYCPEKWRPQSDANKQGSGDGYLSIQAEADLSQSQRYSQEKAQELYKFRLSRGVARELARIDLPLSQYTEWYWKIDLHNLLRFLQLRLDPHAQWEIQEYARAIAKIVEQWVPHSWEAFVDYRLEAVSFSRKEIELIRGCLENVSFPDEELQKIIGTKSEAREFLSKMGKKKAT